MTPIAPEKYYICLDSGSPVCLWSIKGRVYISTHFSTTKPGKTLWCWSRCLQLCNQGSFVTAAWAPGCASYLFVLFPKINAHGSKLWDQWQRTADFWRMAPSSGGRMFSSPGMYHHKNLEFLSTLEALNQHQIYWFPTSFFSWFNFTLTYHLGARNDKPNAWFHMGQYWDKGDGALEPATILKPCHFANVVMTTACSLSWSPFYPSNPFEAKLMLTDSGLAPNSKCSVNNGILLYKD